MLRRLLFALAALFIASTCFAKNINLYEQPKSDAKVIGTLDSATGIVPIFTPKGSDWVKVGDPVNGNVGWVKLSDLAAAGATSTGFSFSQKLEKSGNGPDTYVFKVGVPTLTKEQTDALYKQIQKQQEAIQQSVQKIIQQLFTNFNQTDKTIEIPVVMPVVVMPPDTKTTQPATGNSQK